MNPGSNFIFWKNQQGVYVQCYCFDPEAATASLQADLRSRFIGKTDYDLYPRKIADAYQQQDLTVITKNSALNCTLSLPESAETLTAIKQPLYDDQGAITGVIAHVSKKVDFKERYLNDRRAIKKIIQETLGEAAPYHLTNVEYVHLLKEYLENIIALMPGHVYWLDKNNVYLGCNDLQAKHAGLASRKEIVGKKNCDMPWRSQATEVDELNLKVITSGKPHIVEEYAMMEHGLGFYLSEKVPLRDAQGRILGLVGISFDITERKKAEEERLNLVLKAANMGAWLWDFTDDTFTHEYLYHDEPYRFKGSSAAAIANAHPADQASLREAMLQACQQQIPLDIEYRLMWPDGAARYIAMRGRIIENRQGKATKMVGICWDISKRKALEQTLRQQQIDLAQIARLNAMGELAATLAHELNQPLTTIANYLQGCIIRLERGNYQPEDLLSAMRQAAAQSLRAGKIMHRMKSFICKGKLYYEKANLNHLIQEIVIIIRYEPAANAVNIKLDLAQRLPELEIDKIQIGQVLLNLLRNAIEALQQTNSSMAAEIIIKTSVQEKEVWVDIIDNGPGCSAALAEKLFTPYFTTKKNGTGVGLAICRTIIEAHQGILTILPNPAPGAWFRFSLPLVKAQTNAEAA